MVPMPEPKRQILKPVEPVRTFEAVVAALRDAITSGQVKPGERLASQRDLAEQLGVSRGSVVQAIRVLARAGLVEVRPGAQGGAYVRHFDGSQLVDTLELLLDLDHLSLGELSELRAVVEGQNAAWAAERHTDEDVERLREIVVKVRELETELNDGSSEAWPMILAEDALFHRELARTGHNRAAEAFMIGALGVVNRQLSKLPERCAPEITRSLDAITESVARGDAEDARRLIFEHIQYFALELAEGKGD